MSCERGSCSTRVAISQRVCALSATLIRSWVMELAGSHRPAVLRNRPGLSVRCDAIGLVCSLVQQPTNVSREAKAGCACEGEQRERRETCCACARSLIVANEWATWACRLSRLHCCSASPATTLARARSTRILAQLCPIARTRALAIQPAAAAAPSSATATATSSRLSARRRMAAAASAASTGTIDLQELLSVCVDLAAHAGEAIRNIFGHNTRGDTRAVGEWHWSDGSLISAPAPVCRVRMLADSGKLHAVDKDAKGCTGAKVEEIVDPQTLADLEVQTRTAAHSGQRRPSPCGSNSDSC